MVGITDNSEDFQLQEGFLPLRPFVAGMIDSSKELQR